MLRTFTSLLRRTPALSLLVTLALAIGIGATTVVFSVVRHVLLRPLAFAHPESLVMVWERNVPRQKDRNVVSPGNFIHWTERNRSFSGLAAMSGVPFTLALTGAGEPREVGGQLASAGLFQILGVRPALGRAFTTAEDRPQSGVAIVSDRVWRQALGGDPGVIGRVVAIDGRPTTVVGVLPAGFTLLDAAVDVWLPLGLPPEARTPRGRWLAVVGRLRDGVSREAAQREMEAIVAALTREYPSFNTGWSVSIVPLREQIVGGVRPALLVLFGAMALVLLIACANVANLLLAQASARRRELAVRSALGAGRWRLARHLLGESLMLAGLGGGIGLGLAWSAIALLARVPVDRLPLPRLHEVAPDPATVAFAVGVTAATALVVGLVPALAATRGDLQDALRDGTPGSGAGRGARTRAALVTVEIALAVVLLAGAGLLVRSFVRLTAVPLGFNPAGVETISVGLPRSRYPDDDDRVRFFDGLVAEAATLPGVTAAGAITVLPLAGLGSATSFHPTDRPAPADGQSPVTDVRMIAGDYFGAMGIPLLRGRAFTGSERGEAARIVIVSRTLAEQTWPGEDPIGKRIKVSWRPEEGDELVIGVAGDVRSEDLRVAPRPMIYWPQARSAVGSMSLVVRTASPAVSIGDALRTRVHARDRDLPVAPPIPVEQVIARSIRDRRFTLALLGAFALTAVGLAGVGIYAVMAYTVSRRTREMGIRLALGAHRRDVMRLVLRQTLLLAATGIASGIAAAWMLTRFMRALLFEVEPGDPLTFAGVALLLGLVTLAAGYLPGRRASRVDPMVALRAE